MIKYNEIIWISILLLTIFLFKQTKNLKDDLYLYINKNDKLLSLDFSKKYEIMSYRYLDQLSDSNKIDYSIDIN